MKLPWVVGGFTQNKNRIESNGMSSMTNCTSPVEIHGGEERTQVLLSFFKSFFKMASRDKLACRCCMYIQNISLA